MGDAEVAEEVIEEVGEVSPEAPEIPEVPEVLVPEVPEPEKKPGPKPKVAFKAPPPKPKKKVAPPCRFSVPASAVDGLGELLDAQVEPRVRVMRKEVQYRRAMKYQVAQSTKRVNSAQLGKSLESMISEHSATLALERKLRRKGLRVYSPMAPLPPVARQSKKAQRTDEAGAEAGADTKEGAVLGRRAQEVMQELARMQVGASQWFRDELQRQSRSCPDLSEASKVVAQRQALEQRGSGGLSDVMNNTWRRVLGVASGKAEEHTEESRFEAEKVQTDDAEAIYVDQVERWHRTLVWSQQFDFFDRRIASEVLAEENQNHVTEEDGPVAGALAVPFRAGKHRVVRKPVPLAPLRKSASEIGTWKTSYKPKPARKIEPTSSSFLGSSGTTPAQLSTTLPACWRMGPSASAPILPPPSAVVPGSRSAQPSVIDEWSNEYYGEDVRAESILEHEDVLHTVNPALFPLKQLPLRSPTPLTPGISTATL
jgi:hypothetical protein